MKKLKLDNVLKLKLSIYLLIFTFFTQCCFDYTKKYNFINIKTKKVFLKTDLFQYKNFIDKLSIDDYGSIGKEVKIEVEYVYFFNENAYLIIYFLYFLSFIFIVSALNLKDIKCFLFKS